MTRRLREQRIHKRTKKYIILDLDGTIFNSIDGYRKLWCNFWMIFLIPEWLAEKIYFWLQKLHGAKLHTFRHTLGIFSLWAKMIIWQLMGFGNAKIVLFPKVEELLKKLREKGIIIFASSGALEAQKRLEKAGIAKYFAKAFSREEGTKKQHIRKIAKEILDISVREFSLSAIMVGDIPNDMKDAKKFGIRSIAVTNGAVTYTEAELKKAGAEIVLHRIEDFIKLF